MPQKGYPRLIDNWSLPTVGTLAKRSHALKSSIAIALVKYLIRSRSFLLVQSRKWFMVTSPVITLNKTAPNRRNHFATVNHTLRANSDEKNLNSINCLSRSSRESLSHNVRPHLHQLQPRPAPGTQRRPLQTDNHTIAQPGTKGDSKQYVPLSQSQQWHISALPTFCRDPPS